jgi:hypothetical protein
MSKLKIFNFNELFDKSLKFDSTMINNYIPNGNLKDYTIYSSGDLHGDYYLLMNILLDLTNLIEISNNSNYTKFLNIDNSKLMEEYLNSIQDEIKDIGLQWKKDTSNSLVIFCGDMIDNKRSGLDIREKYGKKYIHFMEIKLLYVIYFLNTISKNNNGILKVCGNHDYLNLTMDLKDRFWITEYSYDFDDELLFNTKRRDYFKYDLNLIPSRLLIHMMFPLINVSEHYFLHGGLSNKYFKKVINVDKINKDFLECITSNKGCKLFDDTKNGILWDRTMSSDEFYYKTIPQKYKDILHNKVIIIGHCPFISSVYSRLCNEQKNNVYQSLLPTRNEEDRKDQEILKKSYIDSNFSDKYNNVCDGKNHGITGQFLDNNKPKLIRLDVSMGQAFDGREEIFDINYKLDDNTKNKGEIYYGRLPQILIIDTENNKYTIRTATVHNAISNNKRGIFANMSDEEIKEKTSKYGLINRDINYKKYIKYKMKYTNLKAQLVTK